ncbi:thiolase family protein [Rhodobacter sp. SGA-6-6]|uniref:thiolase family protein n=1 Tax=Rhodobacter sp. SGA-6-6 TaxID=2710882 RepID=UPI0013EC5928|nr:thiolase family protein [Rhodobacter sp. SGA-6-6]NGM47108.1 thiolase family protein [Rhodobacter sp. SGA-6-6]
MTADSDIVILSVARTPFGRFGGALKSLSAPRLGGLAMAEALRRSGLPGEELDALFAGIGMIGANRLTATRQALLEHSGLPETLPSLGVDRACCSGLTAIGLGWRELLTGQAGAVMCGGFESLSNTPFLWPRQRGIRPGAVDVSDPLTLRADFLDKAIARYTGEEAVAMGVDRQAQDDWALRSHRSALTAEAEGHYDAERFAIDLPEARLAQDESPRSDLTPERLAKLKTVYDSPTVTPGNAPGLNDGAAFMVLATRGFARAHGLEPLAQVLGHVQVAGGATSGSYMPAVAIAKLLERAGRTLADVSRFEINEAFAATPLVSTLFLTDRNQAAAEAIQTRTNLAGGAVALGHPLGASGARIAMTLAMGLRRTGGGLGVASICGGFGQGDALLLDVG